MACRSKSSVIKKRQDTALELGIVPLLTQVLTGVHFNDKYAFPLKNPPTALQAMLIH